MYIGCIEHWIENINTLNKFQQICCAFLNRDVLYRFHRDDARTWLYKADIYGKFSNSKLSSCCRSPSMACETVYFWQQTIFL